MQRIAQIAGLILLFTLATVMPLLAGGQREEVADPVEIMGPFGGPDEAYFVRILEEFTEKTGIEVEYQADPDFNTQIMVRVEAGNPPDIAAIPQPGVMEALARRGALTPLPEPLVQRVEENYLDDWKTYGSYNGELYGLFHRVNAKRFVWYPKQEFEARGYEEPETWDEMIELMDQMVADGVTPWAIGMESGGATGWLGTDWVEDIMLRTAGPEAYDDWITNNLAFNSPEVREAFEYLEQIWLNEDYVLGGTDYIRGTGIGDAVRPLFRDPPEAMLHRQGNFILNEVPQRVLDNMEEEIGFFVFPEINPEHGQPVFGGGDQFVMFDDRPEVREVMEFLSTWEGARAWAESGTAIFPHKDTNFDDYPNAIIREIARTVVEADSFRFDASDMMPAEIGAGAFWEGMVDFVGGVPTDTVLDEIQETWDELD